MSPKIREASENNNTLLTAVYANKIDLDAFIKPVQIQQECGWCEGRGYDPLDGDGEPCPECGGLKYELVTRHYLREALAIALNPAHCREPERKHLEALLAFSRATLAAAYSGDLAERYGRALERIARLERNPKRATSEIDSFRRAKAIAQGALLKTEVV